MDEVHTILSRRQRRKGYIMIFKIQSLAVVAVGLLVGGANAKLSLRTPDADKLIALTADASMVSSLQF